MGWTVLWTPSPVGDGPTRRTLERSGDAGILGKIHNKSCCSGATIGTSRRIGVCLDNVPMDFQIRWQGNVFLPACGLDKNPISFIIEQRRSHGRISYLSSENGLGAIATIYGREWAGQEGGGVTSTTIPDPESGEENKFSNRTNGKMVRELPFQKKIRTRFFIRSINTHFMRPCD